MNGIKKAKGETRMTCAGCQHRSDTSESVGREAAPCEARSLVKYGGYYVGFSDRATGWEGTHCIELAASIAAHKQFIAGTNSEERRGRIGVILEAMGTFECDEAAEAIVHLAAKAGNKPSKVKVVLRRCLLQGVHYLVFLLPRESAPCGEPYSAKT